MMKNDLFDRRKFLKLSAICGTTLLLSHNKFAYAKEKATKNSSQSKNLFLKENSPIDRTIGDIAEKKFYGDENERAHKILWNVEDYLKEKNIQGPVEEVPLVIVGGGASGLFTTYLHKKYKPIVLEQASRFGGNAKGQSWRGMDFGMGSAYIDKPIPGTPMEYFFKELDLRKVLVERDESDPVEYKGQIYSDFWDGESDLTRKKPYIQVQDFLRDVEFQKTRAFPHLPSLNSAQLSSVKYFDEYTLYELMQKVTKNQLPEQLATAMEYYCWSTYAASSKEISAASALNFLAQEESSVYVGAGGNAKILEHLLSRLLEYVPGSNLRTKSIVVQVKVHENYVDVLYEDKNEVLRQIRAKCCILACPKFVVKKILHGIEDERVNAISQIEYRSYLTASLLVKKKMNRSHFNTFMLDDGKLNLQDVKLAHEKRNATDFVLGNFAAGEKDFNVITLYNAFPYANARLELIAPNAYEIQKNRFEKQIENKILPLLNLNSGDVVDLRLARYGHALPVAKKSFYQKNWVESLRKPFQKRVFFIEQDNWAYPSLQTGATEAWMFRESISKLLM